MMATVVMSVRVRDSRPSNQWNNSMYRITVKYPAPGMENIVQSGIFPSASHAYFKGMELVNVWSKKTKIIVEGP